MSRGLLLKFLLRLITIASSTDLNIRDIHIHPSFKRRVASQWIFKAGYSVLHAFTFKDQSPHASLHTWGGKTLHGSCRCLYMVYETGDYSVTLCFIMGSAFVSHYFFIRTCPNKRIPWISSDWDIEVPYLLLATSDILFVKQCPFEIFNIAELYIIVFLIFKGARL